MSRELLAEAIREEKFVKACLLHVFRVYYDGKECPCCAMLREVPRRTRRKVFRKGGVDKFKKWS